MLCYSNPVKRCSPHRPYEENKTVAPTGSWGIWGTERRSQCRGTQLGTVSSGQLSPLLWERLSSGYSCSEWIADPEKGVDFAPLQTRTCCPLHHQDGSCSLVSPPGSQWHRPHHSASFAGEGGIQLPATAKILFLTVAYILQFLSPALHSFTCISSLDTLETAELGGWGAFFLRAPGRRWRPECWEAREEVCCNGACGQLLTRVYRQTCCVQGLHGGQR